MFCLLHIVSPPLPPTAAVPFHVVSALYRAVKAATANTDFDCIYATLPWCPPFLYPFRAHLVTFLFGTAG